MTRIREYTIPGMRVIEHEIEVPLRWDAPDAGSISVFARELVSTTHAGDDLPLLVYLQGGPGGKGPRPVGLGDWIGPALERYRVVLLDQRGTGRSTRVEGRRIAAFDRAEDAAAYLSSFRADSIVRDAEAVRERVFGGRPWTTLGQSYGGFLTLTYLSIAPEGLTASLVTGGLSSVTPSAAEVYRRTYPRVAAKNRRYHARFPDDADQLARIADRIQGGDVRLPDGDILTVRRVQSLGIDFGMQAGFERVHWLLDEAIAPDGHLTDTFLQQVQQLSAYADDPLFAVMQESIYGVPGAPTGWAADAERARHPEFAEDARPLFLTGEMIYPWMFREIRGLRPFRAATELLAERSDWGPLYDLDRLARNQVPLVAAVYFDDMYVDSGLQLETVDRVGNARAWVTNEHEHDGIHTGTVLPHLLGLLADHDAR